MPVFGVNKVSLLIFDECHHAQKNHPYRMIMTDFYVPCEDKPRVFGMTASPIWNSKKPDASIRELQNNMSSKVIAVREHVDSLGEHVNRPIEVSPDLDFSDREITNTLGCRDLSKSEGGALCNLLQANTLGDAPS